MDIGNFIDYIKTDVIYKDIGEDFETRFDTMNYELERPLKSWWKNNKDIGWMKDELGKRSCVDLWD